MNVSLYDVAEINIPDGYVLVRDIDGPVSVTNDAKRVVQRLHEVLPGFRYLYIDSDGNRDELLHVGPTFTGFAPQRHDGPPRGFTCGRCGSHVAQGGCPCG